MSHCLPLTHRSLLLVEDEPTIREMLAEALRDAGHDVVVAASAAQAIDIMGSRHFVAIISDIRLGGRVTGWDVVRCARTHSPEIAAIYMSGDSAHDWAHQGVSDSLFLQKPFTCADMVRAVANVLDLPFTDYASLPRAGGSPSAPCSR
jgi:two-component system cell cycle response regulator CpdR